MIQIYPASKARHYLWWQALRTAGVPIVHPCWVDAAFNEDGSEPTHDGWAAHWLECCDLAASCDVTMFLALPGEQHCGALLEAGAALGAGRQVFAVSAVEFSFLTHPRCRSFDNLAAAVRAIMAWQAGEKARTVARLVCERGRVA
jgi:hypothetical protein